MDTAVNLIKGGFVGFGVVAVLTICFATLVGGIL